MASSGVWVVGVALVALLLSLDAQAQKLSSPPPPKAASPPPPSPPPPSPPPPPAGPAGTVDIRNKVGTGPIQLTFQYVGYTWYVYGVGASVWYTLDATYPGTWWTVGFDTGPTNAVTLYNSFAVAYLSHTGVVQYLDPLKLYPTRIWWYFYDVPGATTYNYKIGNAEGKELYNAFLSFNGVYTQNGATAYNISSVTWSATALPAIEMQHSLPLPLDALEVLPAAL